VLLRGRTVALEPYEPTNEPWRIAITTVPNTVSEATGLLASLGYDDDLILNGDEFEVGGAPSRYHFTTATVDHTYRFEGASDPGDEAIVLGISFTDGRRGVLVSAYGPGADAEHARILRSLARPPAP
jgi:hypothetical protein